MESVLFSLHLLYIIIKTSAELSLYICASGSNIKVCMQLFDTSLRFVSFISVSHLYGFGLMDAEAMVKEAERWKQVPQQHICVENADRQMRLFMFYLYFYLITINPDTLLH